MDGKVEKKINSLTTIVVILMIIILGLVGVVAYKELNKKEENKVCQLTKFDNSYILTDTDKNEISQQITSSPAAGNMKINLDTISVSGTNGYLLFVRFTPIDSDSLIAVAYKLNGKVKILNWGSGFLDSEIDSYKGILNNMCE